MIQHIICNILEGRIETGAVQFNDDWPGLFLRGDNALGLAIHIKALDVSLDSSTLPAGARIALVYLRNLAKMIHDDVVVKPTTVDGATEGDS